MLVDLLYWQGPPLKHRLALRISAEAGTCCWSDRYLWALLYIKLSIYICVLQLHCRLLVLLVDKSEIARATLRQSRTVTGCVLLGIMEGAIGDGAVEGYNAQFTRTAFFCCLTAASGGALFGYDNGMSFAPNQLARKARCR